MKKWNYFFLLTLLFFAACRREENKYPFDLSSVSRTIGKEGGRVLFYSDADLKSRENPKAELIFPQGALDSNIDVGYFSIKNTDLNIGKRLPVSDVFYFSPKQVGFKKPVSITINFEVPKPEDNIYNYQRTFQPTFLFNRIHLMKLYEIDYVRGLPYELNDENNWKEATNYSLDSLQGKVTFEVNSFNKAYCFAFPEFARLDTFILSTGLPEYNFNIVDSSYQDWVSQGFMGLEDLNYLNESFFLDGDTVIFIDLNFPANQSGSVTPASIDIRLRGYYWDYSQASPDIVHFETYTEDSDTRLFLYEYGKIGQRVRGRISGYLQSNFGSDFLPIDFYFSTIRTR